MENKEQKVYEIINLERRARTTKTFGIIHTALASICSTGFLFSAFYDAMNNNAKDAIINSIFTAVWAGLAVGHGIETKIKVNNQKEQIKTLKQQAGFNETR